MDVVRSCWDSIFLLRTTRRLTEVVSSSDVILRFNRQSPRRSLSTVSFILVITPGPLGIQWLHKLSRSIVQSASTNDCSVCAG